MEGIKILVLDRGHVLVGRVAPHPKLAFWWTMSPARIIRRWGTAYGIAELANGPLADTILDALASESIPQRAILRVIDVKESAWTKHLY